LIDELLVVDADSRDGTAQRARERGVEVISESALQPDYGPALAGFRQPLAGEVAATRALLEALPFPAGYGVEIAMLIDAERAVGLERMAQVDLGTRQNRHQPLKELSRMALEVLAAAERRAHGDASPGPLLVPTADDFELHAIAADERPPVCSG
jgi:hypothetical protein